MVHVMLFLIINIFTLVLPEVCAVSSMAVFCSSLMSCFPGILVRYFLGDPEMVPISSYSYSYHICSYVPHGMYFCCKVFII